MSRCTVCVLLSPFSGRTFSSEDNYVKGNCSLPAQPSTSCNATMHSAEVLWGRISGLGELVLCFGVWSFTNFSWSYEVTWQWKALLAYYSVENSLPVAGLTFHLLLPKCSRCCQREKQPLCSAHVGRAQLSMEFNSFRLLSVHSPPVSLTDIWYFLVVLVMGTIVCLKLLHPKQKQNSLWLSLRSYSKTSLWRD